MSANNQTRLVLILVALAALGFAASNFFGHQGQETAVPDYRLPVANPPVEPDRPDLLEEPRIDE